MVTLNNYELDLTATEYRLLSYLARNAGRILTTDQLLSTVWSDEYCGELEILRMHITRLRRKLGEDGTNPRFILTKHGIGYVLETSYS